MLLVQGIPTQYRDVAVRNVIVPRLPRPKVQHATSGTVVRTPVIVLVGIVITIHAIPHVLVGGHLHVPQRMVPGKQEVGELVQKLVVGEHKAGV